MGKTQMLLKIDNIITEEEIASHSHVPKLSGKLPAKKKENELGDCRKNG